MKFLSRHNFKQSLTGISLIATLAGALSLAGCNSGSSYTASSLGTLGVTLASSTLSLNAESTTTVTATLTGVKAGTDGLGAVTVTFAVVNESGTQASDIAALNPESCTIANPTESSAVSCSVQLQGLTLGSAVVLTSAGANSAQAPQNGIVSTQFNVTP